MTVERAWDSWGKRFSVGRALLGIAGGAQTFSSHAWVESGGRPVGEDANEIASLTVLPMERILAHSRRGLERGWR